MNIQVIQGDCRDVLSGFPDEHFDCILTDPPYGETSLEWDRWQAGWPAAARRVLKRTGSMWCFGSMRMFMKHAEQFVGWRFAEDVVWEKHNGSGFHADRFKRVHENAVRFYRDDAPWEGVYKRPQYTDDAVKRVVRTKRRPVHMRHIDKAPYVSEDGGPRLMRSVIYARSEHGRAEHPTQKPAEIVEPLLLSACPLGALVLDCFAGSGTTGVVAKKNGIEAVLIEARSAFVEVIHGRLSHGPLFGAA